MKFTKFYVIASLFLGLLQIVDGAKLTLAAGNSNAFNDVVAFIEFSWIVLSVIAIFKFKKRQISLLSPASFIAYFAAVVIFGFIVMGVIADPSSSLDAEVAFAGRYSFLGSIFGLYFAFINYKLLLNVKEKVDIVMEHAAEVVPEEKYKKIRGWLILVGAGLFFSIVRLSMQIYQIAGLLAPRQWLLVMQNNTLLKGLVIFELAANTIILVLVFVMIFKFFKKKAAFPSLFIIYSLISLAFILIDTILLSYIPNAMGDTTETIKPIVQQVINSAVWIPYFLKSKRAKGTFVN